jgi:hypothetical protein
MILEIGTTSASTTEFYLPAPPIALERAEMIVTKRSIQGDLNVTQTGKNKKSFVITWEFTFKNNSTAGGIENYDDLVVFCNQSSQYYVKIRNKADTSAIFDGFAYLMLSTEQVKYDSQFYNFTLTIMEI